MKKRILLIALIGMSFGTKAQNTFPTTGNVGIGTTNPNSKLDIKSSGAYYLTSPTLRVSDLTSRGTLILESVTDSPTDFVFKNNGTGRIWLSSRNSVSNYDFNIYTNPNGFAFPEINALTVKQNGNIGIGTTTPNAKLAVNGKIHAKEVKVDLTGWPDYVFASTYKLPSLKEVEKHININGHLPNIPNAKEVAENGVLLGEMNKKLLQKIEELTLYAIQQQKEINQLKKENKKINELESKIQSILLKIK